MIQVALFILQIRWILQQSSWPVHLMYLFLHLRLYRRLFPHLRACQPIFPTGLSHPAFSRPFLALGSLLLILLQYCLFIHLEMIQSLQAQALQHLAYLALQPVDLHLTKPDFLLLRLILQWHLHIQRKMQLISRSRLIVLRSRLPKNLCLPLGSGLCQQRLLLMSSPSFRPLNPVHLSHLRTFQHRFTIAILLRYLPTLLFPLILPLFPRRA